jgi:hypothetical protein
VDPVRRLEVRRQPAVHRQHGRREQVHWLAPAAQQVLDRLSSSSPASPRLRPQCPLSSSIRWSKYPTYSALMGSAGFTNRSGTHAAKRSVVHAAAAPYRTAATPAVTKLLAMRMPLPHGPHPPVPGDPLHGRRQGGRVEEESTAAPALARVLSASVAMATPASGPPARRGSGSAAPARSPGPAFAATVPWTPARKRDLPSRCRFAEPFLAMVPRKATT